MRTIPVHIDFNVMKKALRRHEEKDDGCGKFYYLVEKGNIIEENSRTSQGKPLQHSVIMP